MIKKILVAISILILASSKQLAYADEKNNQYTFTLHNQTSDSTLQYYSSGGWGYATLISSDSNITVGKEGHYTIQGIAGDGKYFQVVYKAKKASSGQVAECVMDFTIDPTGKVFLVSTYDHSENEMGDPKGTTFLRCEKQGANDILVADKAR